MSHDTLIYEVVDGIAEIRLNRPQNLNALLDHSYAELGQVLHAIEVDRDIRAVLLAGEGRAFCAGADLNEAVNGTDTDAFLRHEQVIGRRMQSLTKPIIAAVHGVAMGAGAELAISCDFILVAEGTRIGLPEVALGNFLGGGVTWLLPRLVGLAKARELILLGEPVDAAEAVRIGLANRLLPAEGFLEAARAFTREVAAKAPISLRLAKQQLNSAGEVSFEEALEAELDGMLVCSGTRDWREGIAAFQEKRRPVFRGE
jgi:enoyl-CoA hydratase